jgi:hypothetical protein
MVDTRNVTVTSKSTFTATVEKVGGRVTATAPITVKNQIQEIRSIEDIPGVNTALRVDGASLFYNANTGEYDIKSGFANVQSIYISTLFANGSAGQTGQALLTNGNNVFWGQVQISNNATFAYGKRESDLSVNFATFSGAANFAFTSNLASLAVQANNAAFAYGKRESDLSVNFATFAGNSNFAFTSNLASQAVQANNAAFAYGKRETDLSVNFSSFSGSANFAFTANNTNFVGGQGVGALNVNSAIYADYVLNLQLPNTSVIPGTYGNSRFIPIVTVDQYGRINAISTSAVAGVNAYTYSSGNNTFTIQTGDGSIFRAAIDTVRNFTVTGDLTVSGNTTTLNTDNLTVKDAVIRLNDGQQTPFNDTGIIMQRYGAANSTNYNVSIIWDESNRKVKIGSVPENGSDSQITFVQEWFTVNENGNANFLANTQAGNSVIAGTSMVINSVSFTERTYPGEANTALFFNGTIDCGSY